MLTWGSVLPDRSKCGHQGSMTGAAFHGTLQASHGLSGAVITLLQASQGCLVHSTRPTAGCGQDKSLLDVSYWTTGRHAALQETSQKVWCHRSTENIRRRVAASQRIRLPAYYLNPA